MTVYHVYVSLLEIAPPIWRRIELSSETTLAELHKILQTAMGWQDYHLHEFEIGDRRYGVSDPDSDYDSPGEVLKESTAKLSRVLPRKGDTLLYTYDFGDNWTHAVRLEETLPADLKERYPRVVDGARCCPPEDCGGPYGYADLLHILSKSRPRSTDACGNGRAKTSPETFSANTVNLLLQPRRVRIAKSQNDAPFESLITGLRHFAAVDRNIDTGGEIRFQGWR